MVEIILSYLEYPLRMLAAILCGAFVGYERESQMKMAGIRTHSIVSLTASLMMIISKYGFYDTLMHSQISLDPSRIAAGVVTAIGFLGAGVIFTHKMNVSGLTTSAGLWATVGIGMAFGAGMYIVGAAATICILLLQFIFHRNFKWLKSSNVEQITLCTEEGEDIRSVLESIFELEKIKVFSIKVKRMRHSQLEIKLYVCFPESYDIFHVIQLLKENPNITSIDI